MANFEGKSRTNYFHVKDIDNFKKLMSTVKADDKIELIESTDSNNKPVFSFNCYANIAGIPVDDVNNTNQDITDIDYDFDAFTSKLQKLLPDDDVCIIFEIGNEKLRYLSAHATIISSSDIKTVNLTESAKLLAKEMLKDNNWDTQCEY